MIILLSKKYIDDTEPNGLVEGYHKGEKVVRNLKKEANEVDKKPAVYPSTTQCRKSSYTMLFLVQSITDPNRHFPIKLRRAIVWNFVVEVEILNWRLVGHWNLPRVAHLE